jgi:predicted permease
MLWVSKAVLRLRSLFRRAQVDKELEEELRFYLEQQTQENIANGMGPEEAERCARRVVGGLDQIKEECRDARRVNWILNLSRDVRHTCGMLLRNPGFAVAAVVPLAIAIGFSTAVLTLVDAVLFRPLGVKDPGSLVAVYSLLEQKGTTQYQSVSYPELRDIRALADSVQSAAAYVRIPVNANAGQGLQRFYSEMVTGDYFRTVGVLPVAGRPLGQQDDMVSAAPAVVISEKLWERLFQRRSSALGTSVLLNAVPFTIVGVMPRGYVGTVLDWSPPPDFWIPLAQIRQVVPAFRSLDFENRREMLWLVVNARLRRASDVPRVQAALDVLSARARAGQSKASTNHKLAVFSSGSARFFPSHRGASLRYMSVLAVICGIVLLIACVNLANLLLARSAARTKEISTRLALGASHYRIVQQFMVEGVLVAAGAVAISLPLALWLTAWLARFKFVFAVSLSLNLSPDPRVLLASAAACLGLGLLVGILPAIGISRVDLLSGLKESQASPRIRSGRFLRTQDFLVAAQVACSVVVLVSAVLLAQSLRELRDTDLGFDSRRVLLSNIETYGANLSAAQTQRLYSTLLAELRSQPLSGAALAADALPTTSRRRVEVAPAGSGAFPPDGISMESNIVSDGYFEVLGMRVERGRGFLLSDDARAPRAVVLNRTAAGLLWPGENPVGRHIRMRGETGNLEVIGVVADAKVHSVTDGPTPYLFIPLAQKFSPSVTIHVRTFRDPMEAVPLLRRTVESLAKGVSLGEIRTLDQQVEAGLSQLRLAAGATSAAGLVGTLLALAGVFALTAYRVIQQQRETAIRMALGAGRRRVLASFVVRGLMLGVAGAAAGFVPAVWAAGLLRSFVAGVRAPGMMLYFGVTALLLLAVALAAVIAVRRILRMDPAAVLKMQ